MLLNIAFRHMSATDALKSHVETKSEKIRKYTGGDTKVVWTLAVEAGVHHADVRVSGPHQDFSAEGRSESMYQAVDEALEKLEKQLRKNKEILKDHLHRK
jgi:putative sigma-54 modulation protein